MAKKKTAKKGAKAKKAAKKKPAAKAAAPKVSHRPKKKESNKFLIWAVVVVVIVVLLFLLRGREAPEAPEAPVAEPEEVPAEVEVPEEVPEDQLPPTEKGEDFVEQEDLETGEFVKESLIGNPTFEDEDLGTDLTAEPERFSNFKCVYDDEMDMRFISLKLTNTNSDIAFMISDSGVKKGYNVYFNVNGLVDMDPGCGIEELATGEAVVCDNVGLDNPKFEALPGINRLSIQSPNDEGKIYTEAVVVNCEE